MDYKTLLEDIFLGCDLCVESDFIYDADNIINESSYKRKTRYLISGLHADPYVLDKKFFNALRSRVVVVDYDLFGGDVDDAIIDRSPRKFIIRPVKVDKLLYKSDYTSNGLLAICMKRSFGDYLFESKVKRDLKNFMECRRIGGKEYFLHTELSRDLCDEDYIMLSKAVGFHWED